MAMTTADNKKPESFSSQELVDEVFSWSLYDLLNPNLYKGKVEEIPMTFSSVTQYRKSFVYPLFEETHADLLSKILAINSCPSAVIVRVQKSISFKPPTALLYTIFLHQGSYVPQVGDLIALTDVRPKCVDDLKRPNKSYTIALVQGMKIEKPVYIIYVLSSKPINQQDVEGATMQGLVSFGMKDEKHFVVCLTNLKTNIGISKALHSELGDKRKMIEKLLPVDASVKESCDECSIDKTREIDLSRTKEALKTFQLDSSQEAAVLSCIAARECNHRNTVKLIWGPPGTGKTKTIGSLLFMCLSMKCRTLICAPTNIAVLGVTKRVMSLVRDSSIYDNYGLGDIVLFGNEERMKLDDQKGLSDIFLKFRVKILAGCLAPLSGWEGSSEWLIHFLEDPEVQYRFYLKEERLVDQKRGTRENEDNFVHDFEESNDSQLQAAVKKKNWKTLIVNGLPSKQKNYKKNSQENILSFEQFVVKGFGFLGNHLISCVENLYTHMPTSYISVEAAKQMIELVRSLRQFELLLKQTIAWNVGLREALRGFCVGRGIGRMSLHACRLSCVDKLRFLRNTLCFPKFNIYNNEIKDFCLANACLIFCTASSSINLHKHPFEVVVIDEAAQLKECESLIPLQLGGVRHAILVGDERQLPAMVQSKICKEAEFGRSLFERLALLGHKKHLLTVQYRMHPSISQFPNREFYDKRILDGRNVKNSAYGKRFLQGSMFGSYSFINVTSAKEEFDNSHSMKNVMEVAVVGEIVASLFKEAVARKQRVSVGCISPYKAQVNAIHEKLGNKYKSSEKYFSVNVRSVDGFQGSEEDVIIISTVRYNGKGSIGFLSNHQRTNVALTRARYCLWIVGNGPTLMNSGSIWKKLVVDAKDRGCFYNASDYINFAQVAMGDSISKQGKNLAQAAMVDLSQPCSIFNMDYLLSRDAKWKVKFSDIFLESYARFDAEIQREVGSLVIKLSNGWRESQIYRKPEMDIEKTRPLFGRFTNYAVCKRLDSHLGAICKKLDSLLGAICKRLDSLLGAIRKRLNSLLGAISTICGHPQNVENAKADLEVTCSFLEKYNIATRDLSLVWAVDLVVEDNTCIQVLKIWDILPANKIEDLEKMLMDKVYRNYTEYMISRCKEKRVDGNLVLPVTWPIDSETDPSWSLAKEIAALSLRNKQPASASRVSSVSC